MCRLGKLACPRVNDDQKINVGDQKLNSDIWSSEDDWDTKTGRPQPIVVVLECIIFPGQ